MEQQLEMFLAIIWQIVMHLDMYDFDDANYTEITQIIAIQK